MSPAPAIRAGRTGNLTLPALTLALGALLGYGGRPAQPGPPPPSTTAPIVTSTPVSMPVDAPAVEPVKAPEPLPLTPPAARPLIVPPSPPPSLSSPSIIRRRGIGRRADAIGPVIPRPE